MDEEIKKFEENEVLPFGFPTEIHKIIKVIGVGGGGGNAVKNMYREGIRDVVFALANTDSQALAESDIPVKLQLGKGLGAGNNPNVARQDAEDSVESIKSLFHDDTKMVFITAGMGGGTGTGAAPVIARCAREEGMLTVGIVTLPFKFEMRPKIRQAIDGVKEMAKYVDALLVINNERLLDIYSEQTLTDGFRKADETLTMATKSIAELITVRGTINLDFRDVSKVLKDGGVAIMSSGEASGENRVEQAIQSALNSPLLYNNDIYKAKKILFNIYQSTDEQHQLVLHEMNELRHFMDKFEDENIEVIWGLASDSSLGDRVKITVLATGFGMSNIPLGEDDGEDNDPIAQFYDGSIDKKALYTFELEDGDLDNDALINALVESPTHTRRSSDLTDIRALRVHPAN